MKTNKIPVAAAGLAAILSGCAANPPQMFSQPVTSQWTGANGDYLVHVNGTGLTVGQINGREVHLIQP